MIVNKFPFLVNNLGPVSSVFNDNSWETISKVSIAGRGDTYWDIGDKKEIVLNGSIGIGLSLSNFSTYVFILDFNHSDGGISDNNIILGGFKTSTGIDICLCDSKCNSKSYSGIYFNLNHVGTQSYTSSKDTNYNYGGYKGCDFRYDILGSVDTAPVPYNTNKTTTTTGSDATIVAITSPKVNTLMAALPSDFRNVLRLHTHYVDNKGMASKIDANVTAVTDAGIFLLAEYEIFGSISNANSYEANKQTQMTYYKNGANKQKYAHNDTSRKQVWWESSPRAADAKSFCIVSGSSALTNNSYISYGLAPAFKV